MSPAGSAPKPPAIQNPPLTKPATDAEFRRRAIGVWETEGGAPASVEAAAVGDLKRAEAGDDPSPARIATLRRPL